MMFLVVVTMMFVVTTNSVKYGLHTKIIPDACGLAHSPLGGGCRVHHTLECSEACADGLKPGFTRWAWLELVGVGWHCKFDDYAFSLNCGVVIICLAFGCSSCLEGRSLSHALRSSSMEGCNNSR
jgi:hypothetical protein